MIQELVRLDRLDRKNFTWWLDKLKFLLITLKIIYILDPNLASLPKPSEEDSNAIRAER